MKTKTLDLRKIILSLIVIMVAFTSLSFNTNAATSGSTNSPTIYVTTKSNWKAWGSESITLKQNKQSLYMAKNFNSKKTKTKTGYYGCYNITVYNVTTRKTSKIKWSGGQTKKINLSRNCTYKITVNYDSTASYYKRIGATSSGYYLKSYNNPSWYVSSTNKVSSCY